MEVKDHLTGHTKTYKSAFYLLQETFIIYTSMRKNVQDLENVKNGKQ